MASFFYLSANMIKYDSIFDVLQGFSALLLSSIFNCIIIEGMSIGLIV